LQIFYSTIYDNSDIDIFVNKNDSFHILKFFLKHCVHDSSDNKYRYDKHIQKVNTFFFNNIKFQIIIVDSDLCMTQFIQHFFDIDICKNMFWYDHSKLPILQLYDVNKLINKTATIVVDNSNTSVSRKDKYVNRGFILDNY
jgi:hypothetical protein